MAVVTPLPMIGHTRTGEGKRKHTELLKIDVNRCQT